MLDNGLADALATLAASSAMQAERTVSLPFRPTPAIETIAYFCVAELLANAAKHSDASKIKIDISECPRCLYSACATTADAGPARPRPRAEDQPDLAVERTRSWPAGGGCAPCQEPA
jgi:signal transduction histidine kinase